VTNVFIFHGIGGNPEENWFPWLKNELEKLNVTAIVPAFPESDRPDLSRWLTHFDQYKNLINDETMFIGHSLGGAFTLRFLERATQPIHAAFLVASVWGVMGNKFDPLMTTFTTLPYDWKRIRSNASAFHVLHSDNDPYISLKLAEELAKHLGTEEEIIPGGGHFNAGAGYTTFPQLLQEIRAYLR
jgi:hypothetical protein